MRKTGIDLKELPESIRRQAQKKYYAEIGREQRENVLVLGKEECISADEGAEQEEFLRGVYAEGYMAAVCYGADAAIRLITKYLRGEA